VLGVMVDGRVLPAHNADVLTDMCFDNMRDTSLADICHASESFNGGRGKEGRRLSVAALVATIHDRMSAIIPPNAYERWLSPVEADPGDLLSPFPPEPMTMWPISSA
jgi:hypothetical protein